MVYNDFFKVTSGVINDSVIKDGRKIVIKNIRYPVFECIDKNYEKLCAKMNDFYKQSANKFSLYASKNLAKRAAKNKGRQTKPYGAVMNFSISFFDKDFVCIVTDVSGFDGNETYSSRFSHTWSKERLTPMPSSFFVHKDKKARSYIKQEIVSQIRRNMLDSSFGYYGDADKLFLKYFDFENFCFVPKGIAFFIDAGIMCDTKYGPCVFVIPFEKADGLLKIVPCISNIL